MSNLAAYHAYVPSLLAPVHQYLPYGVIDIFGAMRLSMIVNWFASGAFDPPAPDGESEKPATVKRKPGKKVKKSARASLLQEHVGIAVIVFGGETFLCAVTGAVPSWVVDYKVLLLFWTAHTLQTRTPLLNLLPPKPNFYIELFLAVPDAVARTLLLTKFSILPILHPASPLTLPATPSTLILTPFILAVPFPALMFTGLNFFRRAPTLSVPAELQSWGWTSPDAWAPVVCPVMFLMLIGPVKGWEWGLGWSEEEGVVAVALLLSVVFAARVVYNLAPRASIGASKIKTA